MRVNASEMWPLIRPGDELNVQKAAAADLKPGDIIVVQKNGSAVIRRLLQSSVRNGQLFLVTKADNSFLIEQPVHGADCSGKVLSVTRGKRITDLCSWPWKLGGRAVCVLSSLQALVYQIVCRCKALFCR